MRAIVTQVIKNKPHITTGKVIVNVMNKISLVVINKDGGSSIETFDKSKCTIQMIDE